MAIEAIVTQSLDVVHAPIDMLTCPWQRRMPRTQCSSYLLSCEKLTSGKPCKQTCNKPTAQRLQPTPSQKTHQPATRPAWQGGHDACVHATAAWQQASVSCVVVLMSRRGSWQQVNCLQFGGGGLVGALKHTRHSRAHARRYKPPLLHYTHIHPSPLSKHTHSSIHTLSPKKPQISLLCCCTITMAASKAATTAVKAIYAQPAFVPKGPINSGRFNLIREIFIGFSLGMTGGMMWKVCFLSNPGGQAMSPASIAVLDQARTPAARGHRASCPLGAGQRATA